MPVVLQIDTASDITIISKDTWERIGKPELSPSTQTATDASANIIKFHGEFNCEIELNSKKQWGKCLVSNNSNINLLGIDFIEKFKLWDKPFRSICNVITQADKATIVSSLRTEFKEVFSNKLGKYKNQVSLQLKTNSRPVCSVKRPVAYAIKPLIDDELERLQSAGIITPIDFSEWTAPIVVVRKVNGRLRICADYSTGLNDALESHNYPLPTPEEIFSKIADSSIFSHIDLSDAYFQLEVDEESKMLLTITTHRGLFQMNRLPQGIKPATGIFQQIMDTVLAGIDGISAYLDDIVVSSTDMETHIRRLKQVLTKLQEFGFTINHEKCKFFNDQIKYLGYILDKNGLRPDPTKIEAIKNMPEPRNVSQLRSVLGSINHYSKFVPQMKKLREPLDELLKKGMKWKWTNECKKSFQHFKDYLTSELLLTHYNPVLPIIV
jgi:hypothetical protein